MTWTNFGGFQVGRLHALKGEMKDLWSLTVTGNWRIVFHYHPSLNRAQEIDLVDYH